ncbi:class I SAM-dependent DNA methyltransferase, partial [Campylobacter jejuni]|nr:class I SAM-dependent DNA methyltransferase [Campylobacter jejuni]
NIKERMGKYKRIVKDYKEGFYTDKSHINQEIKNLKISFKNFCFADKFKKEMKGFNDKCEKYSKKYGNFLAVDDENLKFFVSANLTLFDFDEKEATKEFANLKKEYDNIFNLESNHPFEWRFEFPEILDDDGNFKGFDLIIGNPPYIRQEEIKELKNTLSKNYKVYKGTADIYTYFYELGFNVLKENGILSFITSNKYTRAGYGEALREFLLKNTCILKYIDLNGIKVFDSATVDTSILSFEKIKIKENTFKYLSLNNELLKNYDFEISAIKEFLNISQNSLSKESFAFNDESTNALKTKIEKLGTPLKDWHGLNINYGIKTGLNEAFIITTEKKDEILANCKDEDEKERTAKLIRKMLRGRDIKRYRYEWAGLWVINTHNGYKSKNGEKVEAINIEHYPSLKKHFDEFYPQLEKRSDKGLTPYNLRNCAYIEEFEKEKIVWAEMTKEACFVYDNSNFFTNQTCYFFTHCDYKYLLAILNSRLIVYYMQYISSHLGQGAFRWIRQYIEKLPIPKINSKNEKLADELINLVDEILKAKEQDKNANTQELENKINSLVYKLYNLTEEEIKIIEGK